MIAALVLAFVLQAPVGQNLDPVPPRNEIQQPAAEIGTSTETTLPGIDKMRTAENPQQAESGTKAEQELVEATWRLVTATWCLVIATVGVVAVGIGASWIAYCTLDDIRKQTQNAGIAARAAEQGAKAALLNAQAVMNSERAWIEIHFDPCWDHERQHLSGEPIVDGGIEGSYFLKVSNYGKTTARIIDYRIEADCIPRDEILNPHSYLSEFSILNSVHTLLPRDTQSDELGTVRVNELMVDWEGVVRLQKHAVMKVTVHYWDMVSADAEGVTSKYTAAVFMYDLIAERFERLVNFNEYT